MKRDYFTLSLVLAGAGFVGYTLLSLKDERPKTSQHVPTAQGVTDPEAVLPAILKELDQKIRVEKGLIVVTEESGVNTYVSSQWLVRCGAGVSITLGVAASGPDGTGGNEVKVELFNGPIDKSACAVIAPRIAARLREKLGR